ncbi:uncharacterized protein LOC124838457 [Vigna umbellata]|uniref:uncharacterized protein LOC124838456 n=1 Tax=Vigna umbellata TaxID=87088 RepID=UPI001F5E898B|nr:uncharacterized protein LOC124838456 [Vigna umbellata]XP_047170013.1 uncharacterized protein LOC124838457 [Vigna umbellata]
MDPYHGCREHHPKGSFSYEPSSHMHGDGPQSPTMAAPPNRMYYSPGMGYEPPPMPLQGYPPRYDPYPNDCHPQPQVYHYPAGPYFSDPPTHHDTGKNKAFVRGFLIFCCVILTGLFVATLVMALMMHPKLPAYTVNSLSVSNFNASTTLTADWNTTFSIQNVNDKLNGFLSGFKVDLLHKNDVLAMSYVPDFELDKKEVKRINAKMSSIGFSFLTPDMHEMAKEQASGSVSLILRIASMVEFKSSTFNTRMSLVLAICDGLKVVFQNNTGNGALDNGGKPISCQLYM